MTGFQSTVNTYSSFGVPGDLAFTGPTRSTSYNLVSTPYLNTVGNAFTVTNGANPDTTLGAPYAGTAQVGGNANSVFAGILINKNEYALYGTTTSPLSPTLNLPDNSVGELLTMGFVTVALDNQPSVGDLVTFAPLTGALSSIPPLVKFVGSSSTTTLTVASITSGQLQVGMLITGSGVAPGTYITALGSGLGGTGTYTISVSQSIAGSTAMTAPNIPAPAVSATATIATTTMTVSAISAGEIFVGMPVIGTGVAAGTIVTAFGSGVGGTGTYTVNVSQTVTPGVTITNTANILIPRCTVSHFDITNVGLAVIKLTN